MSFTRRGIWAETATDEVLSDAATWRLLARHDLEAAIAVRPHHVEDVTRWAGAARAGMLLEADMAGTPVRLAEDRDDLRHLQPERAVRVGQRGTVAVRVLLVALGRVRPDLDAHAGERGAVARTPHAARHPEAAAANALDEWRAGPVVVGAAAHGRGRCEALRARRPEEAGGAGRQRRSGGGGPGQEQGAA